MRRSPRSATLRRTSDQWKYWHSPYKVKVGGHDWFLYIFMITILQNHALSLLVVLLLLWIRSVQFLSDFSDDSKKTLFYVDSSLG